MIEVTEFKNGFRVGTDIMKDVDTVTVSLAISIGSRYETREENGISHFLEHMAFKGTKKRTALEIAHEIEMAGGYMNAFTSKEKTVYYIKVLKNDIRLAIDILSDIIQNSVFHKEEIEKERGVILQELANGEDTPDDIVFEYYYETLFKDQPIGRPIIGSPQTIKSFQKKDFESYMSKRYHAGNMVLSVAGNTTHKEICEIAEELFINLHSKKTVQNETAFYTGGEYIKKNTEISQAQFVIGYKGFNIHDDKIYALEIGSDILGKGMSSRLFQEIREKRGLVYTITSLMNSFEDTGIFGVYAGVSPENIPELRKVIQNELQKIAETFVQDEEMFKTLAQVKAGLLMQQESTTARSRRLASHLLTYGRYLTNAELIAEFESVTKKDIQSILKEVLSSNETLVIYGNVQGV